MISRMTTVGTLKGYRYNLNRSTYTMNQSMNRVITGRQFDSFAESPAIAARTFQLRRSYLRATSQYTVNDSAIHKFDVAWKALDSVENDIDTITDDNGAMSILRSANDADASARNALGQSMAAKAKGIAQHMNGRYSEDYVFAGADTLNAPFTWEAKVNPEYDEEQAEKKVMPYLKADDTYTDDPDLAEQIKHVNEDYDAAYTADVDQEIADVDTARQALEAKWAPLRDDPDYDPKEEDAEWDAWWETYDAAHAKRADPKYGHYITESGGKTNDDTKAAIIPKPNPNYKEEYTFKYYKPDGTGTNIKSEASQVLCYRSIPVDSQDEEDLEKLTYYNDDEKKYLDVGLGYQEKDGKIVPNSVFNVALQGIYYLGGYGTETVKVPKDEDDPEAGEYEFEVPNNIASIMNRLSEILLACDPDDGKWASPEDEAEFKVLASKFEDTSSLVKQRFVELDTQTSFLEDNGELLTNTCDSLQDQFLGLEDVNPAAAISDFMWAKYCYDTALKVGNSVLSQSLMDYMSF